MKYSFFLFLILIIHSSLFAQSKTAVQIAKLEKQRFEAMTQKSITFLNEVLAEEVTYAHSNGLVENKEQHLENIRSGKIVYEKMEAENMQVRLYKKTAVINGILKVKGLYKNTPFNIRLGYLDVYTKRKGKWKLRAWQSVKLE